MLRPYVPVAVHCRVPQVLHREGLIGLRPEIHDRDVRRLDYSCVDVHLIHKLIGKHSHFTAGARVELFIVSGAQPMRCLLAVHVVPDEEGTGGFVNVTLLISHGPTLAEYAAICSKSLVTIT